MDEFIRVSAFLIQFGSFTVGLALIAGIGVYFVTKIDDPGFWKVPWRLKFLYDFFNRKGIVRFKTLLVQISQLRGQIKKKVKKDGLVCMDREVFLSQIDETFQSCVEKLRKSRSLFKESKNLPEGAEKILEEKCDKLAQRVEKGVNNFHQILVSLYKIESANEEEVVDSDEMDTLREQLETRLEIARSIDDELSSLEDVEEEFLREAEAV
jgi:hypothetical protein